MDKYFAADDAQLVVRFSPAGGRAGSNAKLSFSVLDSAGQPAIVSPADVRATVDGPERVVAQTRGAANKYAVHFTAQQPGAYTVEATVRDKFKGRATCRISGPTSGAKSRVEGESRATGGSYSFRTVLVDSNGQPLSTDLGDKLNVAVTGAEGTYSGLESKANGDGTFTTTVSFHKAGQQFSFDVKVNDDTVGNSPWKVSS